MRKFKSSFIINVKRRFTIRKLVVIILTVTISAICRPYLLALLAAIFLYLETTLPWLFKYFSQVLFTFSIKMIIEVLFETYTGPMYSEIHGGDNGGKGSGGKSGKASTSSTGVPIASGATSGMSSGSGSGSGPRASGSVSASPVSTAGGFESQLDSLLEKGSGCPKTVKRTVKEFMTAYVEKSKASQQFTAFVDKEYPKLGLNKSSENWGIAFSGLLGLPKPEAQNIVDSVSEVTKLNDQADDRLRAVSKKLKTHLDTNSNISPEHHAFITNLIFKGKSILPSNSDSDSE